MSNGQKWALHSMKPLRIKGFAGRVRSIKQCQHQGTGVVEVCYGEYKVEGIDHFQKLDSVLRRWLYRETDIKLKFDRGDIPVIVIDNHIEDIDE